MKKIFFIGLIFALGCADSVHRGGNGIQEKSSYSLLGSQCASDCIWSSWAVSSGAQRLTHYCDGVGCHCVEVGDIYSSCTLESSSQEETKTDYQESEWTPNSTDEVYNSYKGQRIADAAYREATRRGTVGWCYNAVADAIESVTGPFLWGDHAYQAADQLSNSSHFFEVWGKDLRDLPEGAVVVWGKGNSRSGHISVSLGNGQEASDHVASQMTYHYGGAPARVFYPR